tara:strand:+ start:1491 stop:2492 length:1002 start_codon:yes stop_codon:yes gene_type:complete
MKPIGPEVSLSVTSGIGTTTLGNSTCVRVYNPELANASLFIRKDGEYVDPPEEYLTVTPSGVVYIQKKHNDTVGSYNDGALRVTPVANSDYLNYKNCKQPESDYTTGLIGHWDAGNTTSYDENGGYSNYWFDLSSNNNDLTLSGNQSFYSSYGGVLGFIGSGGTQGRAEDTSASGISGPPITFAQWLYIYSDGNPLIITDNAGIILGPDGTNKIGMSVKVVGSDAILAYKWGESNTTVNNYNSGLIMPRNEAFLIAASITASEAKLYLFKLDGSVQTATHTTSHTSKSMTKIFLMDNESHIGDMNGIISVVRIYNAVLTQSQLQSIFTATNRF